MHSGNLEIFWGGLTDAYVLLDIDMLLEHLIDVPQ